jgi:hypothetical protein
MAKWQIKLANLCETALGGRLYGPIVLAEHIIKRPLFGCQMCGQCALRYTGFTCSMQCPKQLRNGPCGGAADGHCEVYEDRQCVWVRVYNRSRFLHREGEMERILPPNDWRLKDSSSWINHLAGKDEHLFAKSKDE